MSALHDNCDSFHNYDISPLRYVMFENLTIANCKCKTISK